MTDKYYAATAIKPVPTCSGCGKILLHCKCEEKDLKK